MSNKQLNESTVRISMQQPQLFQHSTDQKHFFQRSNNQKQLFYENQMMIQPQKKYKLASNLVQLSNIQYLMRFINYVEFDSNKIFQRAKFQAEREYLKQPYQGTKLSKNMKQMEYVKLTKQQLKGKQLKVEAIIKQQISKSLQKKPASQHLSKQQLLNLAHQKVRFERQKQHKLLQTSRRSYQYTLSLKQKIQNALQSQQQDYHHQTLSSDYSLISLQQDEIIKQLEKLQKRRYSLKMQYYYVEKQEKQKKQEKMNYKANQLYNQLVENVRRARKLYQSYFLNQQQSNKNTKILQNYNTQTLNHKANYNSNLKYISANQDAQSNRGNQPNGYENKKYSAAQNNLNIYKNLHSFNSFNQSQQKKRKLFKIQKFLNGILLDQRQINLMANQQFNI